MSIFQLKSIYQGTNGAALGSRRSVLVWCPRVGYFNSKRSFFSFQSVRLLHVDFTEHPEVSSRGNTARKKPNMAEYNTTGMSLSGVTIPSGDVNCTNSTEGCGDMMAAGDAAFEFWLYVVTVPILFGLVTVVGIIGNGLVIYVICSRQKMRTVTNLLLLNLAIADMSFILIIPPLTAYMWAMNSWPFGVLLCKTMHFLLNVSAYVTVYTLVLISVVRYLTIVYSTETIRFRTKQNMVILCVLIWAVMLSVNIPITLSYTVKDFAPGVSMCLPVEVDNDGGRKTCQSIYATFFTFAYVLPLFVIAVFSFCILHHINKQRSTMLEKKNTKSDGRKKQATRVIILVVAIFATTWLPIHIHLLVHYFHKDRTPETKIYLTLSIFWNFLAYLNSCVNPIIYNYASKDFRDSFREVVMCGRTNTDTRRGVSQSKTTVSTRAALNSTPNSNGGELKRLVPKENGEQEKLMDTADVWHLQTRPSYFKGQAH